MCRFSPWSTRTTSKPKASPGGSSHGPFAWWKNLLLDPEAIWKLLQPYRDGLPLRSPADVAAALDAIYREQLPEEVRLRVLEGTRAVTLRLDLDTDGDLEKAVAGTQERFEEWRRQVADLETLRERQAAAKAEADLILASGRAGEAFHGKAVLKAFHTAYGKPFPYRTFVYELARCAKRHGRLAQLVSGGSEDPALRACGSARCGPGSR